MIVVYFLITYFLVSLFGYLAHKSLHKPWMGKLYTSHTAHHKIYPLEDYKSEKYRYVGKDDTLYVFALLSIPIVLIPIILCYFGILSLVTTICILAEMLLIGWLNDYLHGVFHIKNHFLYKIPIINQILHYLSNMHYMHHKYPESNFGIFHFMWDKIFKTLKKE